MDGYNNLQKNLFAYSLALIIFSNTLGACIYLFCRSLLQLTTPIAIGCAVLVSFAAAIGIAKLILSSALQPLRVIRQAIMHVTQNDNQTPAPQLENLHHGRALANELVHEIYSLSTREANKKSVKNSETLTNTQATAAAVFDSIPLPIIALDTNNNITACNIQACNYIASTKEKCMGKSIYDVMNPQFLDTETLESWLTATKANAVTAIKSWDRVRLPLTDPNITKQFDIIARFSRDDPNRFETIIAIFDHTDKYTNEDSSASYVALAVHELRTPLTVLRGYIEVFEEELDNKLTPELKDFMHKMSASAQTLTAFVSNILNVARVDENQMDLTLQEANWNEVLPQIVKDLDLRAKVRGKSLKLEMTPQLPTVAIDYVSIYEVVSNLIENSIKYSSDKSTIRIYAMPGKDGLIDTIVEDKGVGIPSSALNHLFTKFYRSHRSMNRVSGSGLGLYLVKAIITAHGGYVWAESKEGEGSRFGFSLKPFASLSAELKNAPTANIKREAHGWIKNHSIYRR